MRRPRHKRRATPRVVLLFPTIAILAVGVLTAGWPASAAKPHKGGRYFGFEGSETVVAMKF